MRKEASYPGWQVDIAEPVYLCTLMLTLQGPTGVTHSLEASQILPFWAGNSPQS